MEIAAFIIDLLCDVGGWKTNINHLGTLYHHLRMGLNKDKSVWSIISAPELMTTVNKFKLTHPTTFPDGVDLTEVWTTYIANGIAETDSHHLVDCLILMLSIYGVRTARFDLEGSVLILLMSIVKTGTADQQYISRRFTSFRAIMTHPESLVSEHLPGVITDIWKSISHHLENNVTTIDYILDNLTKVTCIINNVVIQPMTSFLAYRGLTPLVFIAHGLNSFPTFPWNGLIKYNSTIKAEFKLFREILMICKDDVLLGYKTTGAGTAIPNLPYLAVKLAVDVGGNETMSNYKEIGPNNKSRVTCANYLDSLISAFQKDIIAGDAEYAKLKNRESKLTNVLERSGLTQLMSEFLSHTGAEEDTEEQQYLFDFPESSDSDSDDSSPPPSPHPKGKKRHRSETRSDRDKKNKSCRLRQSRLPKVDLHLSLNLDQVQRRLQKKTSLIQKKRFLIQNLRKNQNP